jgi:hypothetical protein
MYTENGVCGLYGNKNLNFDFLDSDITQSCKNNLSPNFGVDSSSSSTLKKEAAGSVERLLITHTLPKHNRISK